MRQQAVTAATEGLYAVVLAAGAARRFGSAKQLLPVHGRALVLHVAQRAVSLVGEKLIVVLGARAQEIEAELSGCPGRRLVNPAWEEGIGSSLRAGISALPEECAAVLVMLADQAAVSAADLQRLIELWRAQPQDIAAASYGEPVAKSGVPAIFPQRWFAALRQLSGDTGARALLTQHAHAVHTVAMPSAALDIDTPEDAARYLASAAAPKR